jgi:hypothetical protein
VRALLAANPADTFELTVFAGGCDTIACEDIGYTDFERAFDFRMDVAGTLTGECPCWNAPAAPVDNVSVCTDQTQTFYVRVRRRPGSALSCASYTLELTNGVY